MRKNLTISLNPEDWQKIQSMARALDGTYSLVIHKLIAASTGSVSDHTRIDKYRALLAPHADFLESRARVMAKARKRGKVTA